MFSTKPQH